MGDSPSLDDLARRLAALEHEVADLRRTVKGTPRPAAESKPVRSAAPVVSRAAPTLPPRRSEAPARHPSRVPPTRRPAPPPRRPPLTVADFFSAQSLAWMGGAVTLLGIVFFFVLAVNRGWIGPVARVSLGAIASALVFGGGLYLHGRYGRVHSAYAAVGAGLAGGYATLLAATVGYGLVPNWAALLVAAAIAAVAVSTALAWSSELIAGLGLIGATLAPAAVGLQNGELTAAGTGFAALVFAGTAIVAIERKWQVLLLVGVAASLPQAAVLVGQARPAGAGDVAVAAVFWLLFLAAAVGLQRRLGSPGLAPLPVGLILVSASFAGAAVAAQFAGSAEGWTLVAVAAVYGAVSLPLFAGTRSRDLSALLATVGLAVLAFGVADLLSGPALAIAWAAEAAVLSWLARRVGELRYQLASFAYLAAALAHALALDAPLRQLYVPDAHPAAGALSFVGVAAAGAIVAWFCRPWPASRRIRGFLAPLWPALEGFRKEQRLWRSASGWTAALAALYAASLAVLALAQWSSGASVERAFEWGQVGVAGLWGLATVAVLETGLRRSWREVRAAGLVWLGATLVQAVLFFPAHLSGRPQALAFIVVAAALLVGSLADRLRRRDAGVFPAIAVYTVSSLGLAVAAAALLVTTELLAGLALLALSALYCAVAGTVFRRDRDLATVLWAPALFVALVAFALALSGVWLVLGWSVTATALAAVASRVPEPRLEPAAIGYALLATAHVLTLDAPPSDFFEATRHPESGVPAVLLAMCAAAGLVLLARSRRRPADPDRADAMLERREPTVERSGIGVATILALYAVSLSILGLAEAVGTGTVADRFHAGHAAVSAVWGLLGLVALYAGLRRRLGWLQAVGFGLFAVSLAKIFLFDLAFLSSVARALSFLAVGAVLLLGGFFVQRLGAQQRPARPA
ncbi:MAG TPA: DUF2339 domain-containing protein [Gaiellaceae bacterium]|nr:DUF2339 domain-containing protein [Gaiellaceae bacterium]